MIEHRINPVPLKVMQRNRIQIPKLAFIEEKTMVEEYLQDDNSVLIIPDGVEIPDGYSGEFKISQNQYKVHYRMIVISSLSDIRIGDYVNVFKLDGGAILIKSVCNDLA